MNQILPNLRYWLVDHPTIHNFEWVEGQTFGSSPTFLILTIASYLFFTFFLSHIPLPSISPHVIKPITALHNLVLLVLSFTMALGCTLSSIYQAPNLDWIVCFPPRTPPAGPIFFWAYIFYLSKILEFVDTLLIILTGSFNRLSFLHVYHHSTVLFACYLWLHTSQSLFPVGLVTNASVHVLMYGYYFLCTMGIRPNWKKMVTDCQIVQFLFGFVVSSRMLYEHFGGSGPGCSGFWSWSFSASFTASLLVLFINFHVKSYAANKKKRMEAKTK